MTLDVVFLGTGGCIRVPTFNCTCTTCEEARRENTTRTRASIAIIGKKTTIIDASPDLSSQLEREQLRKLDNIFLTHWHFDHVWGLAEIVEPKFMSKWTTVNVYLPEKATPMYTNAMGYVSQHINLHLVNPGDIIRTIDAEYVVVKTNHTPDSVGYVVKAEKSLAYLVDSYTPPNDTVEIVSGVDILVLDAIVDKMVLMANEERWTHFTVDEAVEFWKGLDVDACILTHLTCHNYVNGEVIAGYSAQERIAYEAKHEGLVFAYDGLRVSI